MSTRARRDAALRGWAARRARAEARSDAARRGWETRRTNALTRATQHGQRARERSERALTPQQKAARTRDAQRIEQGIARARRSETARKGWDTRRARERRGAFRSLDSLMGYDDYDEYDIEVAPTYGDE